MPFKAHHELSDSFFANKILDLLLQLNVIFGIMTVVSMILVVFGAILLVGVKPYWVGSLLNVLSFHLVQYFSSSGRQGVVSFKYTFSSFVWD